jgi:enoyl-CoA hydratase
MSEQGDGRPGDPASVDVSVEDHVGLIVLNRPHKLNALDLRLRRGLFAAFEQLEADDECRCIVLAAEGRSFCVGADLVEMSGQSLRVPSRNHAPHLRHNVTVDKPVIAAVQGHALAGGFLMAQMCDLVLAGESAQFGITEVKRGRGAPWAAPLITKIGERHMMEILLTGRPISARRAYEIGLVNAVVPDGQLRETALGWAREIAANAPLSVRAAKQLVYAAGDAGGLAGISAGDAIYRSVYESDDAQEGPLAFAEGREPNWTNR